MGAYVELYIDRGADFSSVINLTDDTTSANINITGYSVTSRLKRSYASANISANLTCVISNTMTGEITMSMTSANTANLKAGRYVFDLVTTDNFGVKTRVLEGVVTVNPNVT